MQVLYAKQGRSRQFTTQAARDKYLHDEIKSLKGYEKTQQKRVEDLQKDVEGAKTQLEEVLIRSKQQASEDGERRENLRAMGEEVTKLKAEVDAMQEQRKNLWREDGKLGQTVSNAKTTMEEAQRSLQGMMDKVSERALYVEPDADETGYEHWSSLCAGHCCSTWPRWRLRRNVRALRSVGQVQDRGRGDGGR